MSHKPDLTEIEAALRRAAHKAVYGTREERSGRYLRYDEQQGDVDAKERSAEPRKSKKQFGRTGET